VEESRGKYVEMDPGPGPHQRKRSGEEKSQKCKFLKEFDANP
jgi:hypothetical protein